MKDLGILKKIYDLSIPYIKLNETRVKSTHIRSFDSKLGGMPHIPNNSKYYYPISSVTKKPLNHLAQINFVDMPHLEPFPRDGLLQFFINFEDDCFGFDDQDFVVQYIPFEDTNYGKYDNPINLDFICFENEYSPIEGTLKLNGRIATQAPTLSYIDFKDLFSEYSSNPDFHTYYSTVINCYNEHQIGGYPDCCQGEFDCISPDKDYVLLLQLGCTDHVCFGDAGVMNFFIERNDLACLNFSNVRAQWDCS